LDLLNVKAMMRDLLRTTAAILLLVGRLADIVGRRRTFVWGTGTFMLFSLSTQFSFFSVLLSYELRSIVGILEPV